MKVLFCAAFFVFAFTSCQHQATESDPPEKTISLTTDRISYNSDEDIHIRLTNNSDSTLIIGLICGEMLQLYYQVYENNSWSASTDLYILGCPTFFDSLESQEDFSEAIHAAIFKSPGNYRLLINARIISNSFVIN